MEAEFRSIGKDRVKTYPHLGFRLTYQGAAFSGFQIQEKGRTVQAEIEKALAVLFRQKSLRISFTSRTDAGVSAWDQWALLPNGVELFEKLAETDRVKFKYALNAILPVEIRCWELLRIRKDFHLKKSVSWKEYRYRMVVGPLCDPFQNREVLLIKRKIDLPKIAIALKALKGTHDFASFGRQSGKRLNSTARTLLKVSLQIRPHPLYREVREVDFVFRGDGFLQYMCRNLVGTLCEIGFGAKLSIASILKARDRTQAGPTAPPHPLCLQKTAVNSKYFQILS